MRAHVSVLVIIGTMVASSAPLKGQQVTGELELEMRAFPRTPLFEGQKRNNASLRFQPELSMSWDRGRTTLTVEPFVRIDASDGHRSHVDLRELSFVRAWPTIELRIGVRKVFWGVTESQHLVDVINQTDLVENLDGEDKLGQPMVNLALVQSWGTFEVYLMPLFRERTFAGTGGRLRFPLTVNDDAAVLESSAGRHHLDLAFRWSHFIAGWDLALSHFRGTNREPRLEIGQGESQQDVFIPHYDQMNQTGADVQLTSGAWLWKFEGITRSTRGDRLWALTAGSEYTLFSVLGNTDLGLFGEYLWDSRDGAAVVPFEDDVALGARFAFNDTQSSELVVFTVMDRNGEGNFISVEGSRRIGAEWTLSVETRAFLGMEATSALYALRRDAYVGVSVTRYF